MDNQTNDNDMVKNYWPISNMIQSNEMDHKDIYPVQLHDNENFVDIQMKPNNKQFLYEKKKIKQSKLPHKYIDNIHHYQIMMTIGDQSPDNDYYCFVNFLY